MHTPIKISLGELPCLGQRLAAVAGLADDAEIRLASSSIRRPSHTRSRPLAFPPPRSLRVTRKIRTGRSLVAKGAGELPPE